MPSEIDRTIWKNVWRIAQEKGLSKRELAKKAGTDIQSIDNIASGRRGVGKSMIRRLAAALVVPESYLMLEETTLYHAAEGGPIQRDVVTIPDEILEIYGGDNQALKDVVTGYASSLLTRLKAMKQERDLLQGKIGATPDSKQPSQGESLTIDEVLAKAMNS